jgi:photosystem II stability/assembly factor-like uncharacterized protein
MTNDGGKTWEKVFNVWNTIFRTCIFTSGSIGFVAGGKGLYKTSDSGTSWEIDSLTSGKFRDIFFLNKQFGFAAKDTSILETLNGGGTWLSIMNCNTCSLNSIFFIDESTGWAVGETGLILKLTDKGIWKTIASGTTLPLNKVFFADKYTGWIAGGYRNSYVGRITPKDFYPVLLKTRDGGESWSKIGYVNYLIHDFYFKNDQEGWAVGEDKNGKGIIIETIDGGNNWSVQVDSLRVPLNAIDFKDVYGWAVGNGLVLKLNTILVTFRSVPSVCVDAPPFDLTQGSPAGGTYSGPGIVTSPWFDPDYAGVGTHTITYTYTDSRGKTDSATQIITVKSLKDVTFRPVPEVCVNWAPFILTQGSPTGGTYSGPGIVTSPQFDPAKAGVGKYIITYTGCSNSATQTITVNALPEVTFGLVPDVCVDAGVLSLTQGSPAGGTYSGPGITTSPQFDPSIAGVGMQSITYTYANDKGCTSSAMQTIIVVDTSEITFGSVPDVCVNATPLKLTQGSPAGGTYSGIGITTSPQFDPAIAGVGAHSITYTYTDDNGCTNSAMQIITVSDSTNTAIEENDEKYNNNTILFQNYPNPFISTTSISYHLAATGEVGLSIYDLTGRKVTTLVNEQQQAGSYEVELNDEGMTPGIYFCELKAGQSRKIVKMILIK